MKSLISQKGKVLPASPMRAEPFCGMMLGPSTHAHGALVFPCIRQKQTQEGRSDGEGCVN